MSLDDQNIPQNTRPQSSLLLERAKQHMPLGVAESYRYWGDKKTVFIKHMKGCTIRDVDDNEYIDFRLGYGPIILGYRDARVDQKVIAAISDDGTTCGFSTAFESELAERIKALCPQIDKLRFANSGTEAVMAAVRTARGFTKREKILVVEGGFHGLYDEMMWRTNIDEWQPGLGKEPEVIPFGGGIASNSNHLIEIIPLNSFERLAQAFAEKGDEIAAVVIEPMMGNCGSIEATPDYMKSLRDTCDQFGSLLIIDEVKTGFRVGRGGVQELYGIHADLTTYAKAMGNGYPIAAFGGRADVMDTIHFGADGVVHGGTYSGNLVGMAGAIATLDILTHTDALKTVESTGKQIMEVLASSFAAFDIPLTFAGHSSMFGVHISDHVPSSYRDWKQTDHQFYAKFAHCLIEDGIMLEPDSREPWFICEAHSQIDLGVLGEKIVKAIRLAREGA